VKSGAPKGLAVSLVLLLNKTNIIWYKSLRNHITICSTDLAHECEMNPLQLDRILNQSSRKFTGVRIQVMWNPIVPCHSYCSSGSWNVWLEEFEDTKQVINYGIKRTITVIRNNWIKKNSKSNLGEYPGRLDYSASTRAIAVTWYNWVSNYLNSNTCRQVMGKAQLSRAKKILFKMIQS
jgi:hypothetical protein